MAGQQTITAVITADSKPFKKGMNDAAQSTSKLTSSLKNVGKVGALAFAAAAVGVGVFAVSALKAAAESEAVSRSLANAAKNAKAFGSSVPQIEKVTKALDDQSTKLSNLTGVDDEYINSLKTAWLGVPAVVKLGVNGINDLATITLDIAAQTGKEASSIATAFSKAFSDPEGAVSKLQKAGVFLSDAQKKSYDDILKTNGAVAAQQFLLKELGKAYEGAAKAAANPFERLKVIFGNLQETVGKALLPAFEKFVDAIAPVVDTLGPVLAQVIGALTPVFDVLAKIMPDVGKAIAQLAGPLELVMKFIADLVVKTMPLFNKLWSILGPILEQLIPPILELVDAAMGPLLDIVGQLFDAIAPVIEQSLPILIEMFRMVTPYIGQLMQFIGALALIILKLVVAFQPLLNAMLPIMLDLMKLILPPLTWLIDKMTDGLLWVIDKMSPALDDMNKAFQSFTDGLKPVFDWVKTVADGLGVIFGYSGKTVDVKATTSIWPQPVQASTQPAASITINASSVNTSAATGQAVATALDSYLRSKGTTPFYLAKR